MYDLYIKNGLVVDGTGRPGRVKDVGIVGDTITHVDFPRHGNPPVQARKVIDAAGKVVAPGFIDVHGHSDALLLMDLQADSKITQGITTDIGGNCGLSAGPYENVWFVDWWVDNPKNFHAVSREEGTEILRRHGLELTWSDLGGFLDRLQRERPALNYGSLVGHYVLRATVYDEPDTQPWRRPATNELERMKDLVRTAMEQGALGVSCAFHHTDPELDVDPEEFKELARVVADYDGVFAFHLRDYTAGLQTAVREAIELADDTGCRTTISHLWGDGKESWGKVRVAMANIEKARARGIPIWCDVLLTLQPRNYMSGGLATLFPDDVAEAAEGRWSEYFSSAETVRAVGATMAKGGSNRWYKERFNPLTYWPMWDEMMRVIESPARPDLIGLSVYDVSRELDVSSTEALCLLMKVNDGAAETMLERTDDEDIITVMNSPASMIGTDGSPVEALQSSRPPNPRLYSTFPRLFAHFVRDLGVISLESAVQKASMLPAEFLGLSDRGTLAPGKRADVVVFDPQTVQDQAHLTRRPRNYTEYSTGIEHVAVNGALVVSDGAPTGQRGGQVLRRSRR